MSILLEMGNFVLATSQKFWDNNKIYTLRVYDSPLKLKIYFQILLLEAGIEEPEVANIPAFAFALSGSNIDWMYHTQPQQYACQSRKTKECVSPRGKVCIHIFL